MYLSPEEVSELNINIVPLTVTLHGKSYGQGLDIGAKDFYSLLSETREFPVTSQPSPGIFVETYRRLAASDPDILSVHISSGLSGTLNVAQLAATMVSEAKINLHDTKTLSAAAGWQAIAAARALKANWAKDQVIALMKKISNAAESIFTLNELRYLAHGGRVSHIKNLLGSVLNIKPIIGVEKVKGTYVQLSQAWTFEHAIGELVNHMSHQYSPDISLRVQVVHGQNLEGAQMLRDLVNKRYKCTWLPTCSVCPVLGAHTGPSVVGIAYAPESIFEGIP